LAATPLTLAVIIIIDIRARLPSVISSSAVIEFQFQYELAAAVIVSSPTLAIISRHE